MSHIPPYSVNLLRLLYFQFWICWLVYFYLGFCFIFHMRKTTYIDLKMYWRHDLFFLSYRRQNLEYIFSVNIALNTFTKISSSNVKIHSQLHMNVKLSSVTSHRPVWKPVKLCIIDLLCGKSDDKCWLPGTQGRWCGTCIDVVITRFFFMKRLSDLHKNGNLLSFALSFDAHDSRVESRWLTHWRRYWYSFVQDCSISSALARETRKFCTKPSIFIVSGNRLLPVRFQVLT